MHCLFLKQELGHSTENVGENYSKNYVFYFLIDRPCTSTSPFSDAVLFSDVEPQPIVDEEEGLLWVVGPVLAVIFIISIVILILLFKRWERKRFELRNNWEFDDLNVD